MKESNIRPRELFDKYLQLAREDINEFFLDKGDFVDIPCPACQSEEKKNAFDKFGFSYVTCLKCNSLYLSPRPTQELINAYYKGSRAVRFWSTNFYKATVKGRREKMFRPRGKLVAKLAKKVSLTQSLLVDVGSGYGIFLEEIKKLRIFNEIIGIEPNPELAGLCQRKGFSIIKKPVEKIEKGEVKAGMATSFELLEHVYSPAELLKTIRDILATRGLLLFTTLTISGFDLQVLWDKSKSIYPPHHINLLSFEGIKQLVERCGFRVLELCTPGKLDVDIVLNMLKEEPSIKLPQFILYLLDQRDERTHNSFQTFLQRNGLSSHLRCLAEKL